jgi:hypothetical protein
LRAPAPTTAQGAQERLGNKEYQLTDWYFSKKKLS